MRARQPDADGFVERDGVRVFYEVFGDGDPTLLLLPTWSIVHSRVWKAVVPTLARHYRVVTFDGPGNGRSDRPERPEAYADEEIAAHAVAVMEATGTERAVVVGVSMGGWWGPLLACDNPERVSGLVLIGPLSPLAPANPDPARNYSFTDPLDTDVAWARFNQHYWRRDFEGFLQFFFSQAFNEPHSTKVREDGVGWGLDTDPETLINTVMAPSKRWGQAKEVYAGVRCPVLVIHGSDDEILPWALHGVAAADGLGADFLTMEGGGHNPAARDPVATVLAIRQFVDRVHPPEPAHRRWTRAHARPRRALYLSSPIGLGHAQRDVAIAHELRRLHPDLAIDWLAQHPVTAVLEARGERIHPASAHLVAESAHIESESGEHDLHAFQAFRRMDEILVSNFMLFHDVLAEERYDLVIGDEAWDVDYFWHENPELKTSAYCWLTDFVGWLPMPDGGDGEAAITADYNAEMLEQVERYRRIRDRALFVGNPEDIVPDSFGPGLPSIRDWTEAHYDFCGYVTGFDPREVADREALRADLGYGPDERVCIVTVGGSGVGAPLLRRIVEAFPEASRLVPGLRMVVVAGPRIDPASLPSAPGLEIRPYVDRLYRHLAACDLAVVQGGLTTCMELAANRRPFLYFPLRHHFEQNFHVRHRLERYGAGRRLDYDAATPEVIAAAIHDEIGRPVACHPVETDGAARAARLIADLL
jgi:pimeloyl-ACP methyl ester carboxylesterase